MTVAPEKVLSEISPEVTGLVENIYSAYLAKNIPVLVKSAPVSRLKSIIDLNPDVPDWYIQARPFDRQYLQEQIQERCRLQDVIS
jgi:hypothetical protein